MPARYKVFSLRPHSTSDTRTYRGLQIPHGFSVIISAKGTSMKIRLLILILISFFELFGKSSSMFGDEIDLFTIEIDISHIDSMTLHSTKSDNQSPPFLQGRSKLSTSHYGIEETAAIKLIFKSDWIETRDKILLCIEAINKGKAQLKFILTQPTLPPLDEKGRDLNSLMAQNFPFSIERKLLENNQNLIEIELSSSVTFTCNLIWLYQPRNKTYVSR